MTHERTIVFESYLLSGHEEGVRIVSSSLRLKASVKHLSHLPSKGLLGCVGRWLDVVFHGVTGKSSIFYFPKVEGIIYTPIPDVHTLHLLETLMTNQVHI